MDNPQINIDDQQYDYQVQQRKKRMLILISVLMVFYIFSMGTTDMSEGTNQQDYSGYGSESENDVPYDNMNGKEKAMKLLEDTSSSIDGYKDLYKAFYDRFNGNVNKTSNNFTELSESDLLFGTLYSLKKKKFDGEWKSEGKNNLLGFFDNKQGHFKSDFDYQNEKEIKFNLHIYDDQYIDHKVLDGEIIISNEPNFTVVDKEVQFHNISLTFSVKNDLQVVTSIPQYNNQTIPVNLTIIFNEQNDSEKYINKYSPLLKIKISNQNEQDIYQNINISAEVDLEEENQQKGRQAMYYSIFLTIILSIQFFFVIKMMKSFLVQDNEEQKFSLLSLSIVFIWDGFFCFLHLDYAISFDHQFHYYITPCFLYMILWNIFERGLITIVWRNRHANIIDQNVLNKKKMQFFFCLYTTFFLSFFAIKQFQSKQWFLYLVNLYLVPQIVRNARRGQQVKVCKSFIFGFMMIRSIPLLYYRGCPENIVNLSPWYSTCVGVILLLIVQVRIYIKDIKKQLFYLNQQYLGPRFFIPARFQTDCYNYYYKLPLQPVNGDVENQGQNDECTICITELTMQPEIQQKSNYFKKLSIKAKQKQNYIMKTPCEHKYHIPCLLKWMEVKMECPTCRAPLPPVL